MREVPSFGATIRYGHFNQRSILKAVALPSEDLGRVVTRAGFRNDAGDLVADRDSYGGSAAALVGKAANRQYAQDMGRSVFRRHLHGSIQTTVSKSGDAVLIESARVISATYPKARQ